MSEHPQNSSPSSRSPQPSDPTIADLLTLPDAERRLMNWLVRRSPASLTDIATHLEASEADTQQMLQHLAESQMVQIETHNDVAYYSVHLRSMRRRRLPKFIDNLLDDLGKNDTP